MKKYKSYFFLSILFIIFLIVGYFLIGGNSKENNILEVIFISDRAISEKNSSVPNDIMMFAKTFTENPTKDFIGKVSFKRIDIEKLNADTIMYSKTLNSELSAKNAQKIFDSENTLQKSTINMYTESKNTKDSFESDTTNIRYFYLVEGGDKRIDNIKYFSNAILLRDHINGCLKNNSLFLENQKINTVTILKLKIPLIVEKKPKIRYNEDINELPVKNIETQVENTPTTKIEDKPINIETGLKRIKDLNKVQWNKELTKHAKELTIRFTVNGIGVLADESVMGKSTYDYCPQNSDAQGRKTKVELIADFGEKKVVLSGNRILTDQYFSCDCNHE